MKAGLPVTVAEHTGVPMEVLHQWIGKAIDKCLDEPAYSGEWAEIESCAECGASVQDGEGYDGLCGECADRAEGQGRWS